MWNENFQGLGQLIGIAYQPKLFFRHSKNLSHNSTTLLKMLPVEQSENTWQWVFLIHSVQGISDVEEHSRVALNPTLTNVVVPVGVVVVGGFVVVVGNGFSVVVVVIIIGSFVVVGGGFSVIGAGGPGLI